MRNKIKYYFYKFELLLLNINTKLPRLFRISKFGLITTFISLIIATSITVVHARDCSNLETWLGDQSCDASTTSGLVPGMISTANSILSGRVEQGSDGSVSIKGSLLVAVNNLVVETYNQTDQLSGTRYIADTLEEAGIVKPVQAATPGVRAFQPVLEIWKVMRNLSLSFIIILGLILSLMILLRVKQGQGYVNIMNALPKLVVAIVLIIFSYSIAGLLVDLGNVAEKAIVSIFFKAEFISNEDLFFELQDRPNRDYPYNIYGPGIWGKDKPDGTRESYKKDFNVFRLMSRFTEFETWGTVDCKDPNDRPDWFTHPDPSKCPISVTDIIRTPTGIGLLERSIDIGEKLPVDEVLKLILTIIIITSVLKVFFALVSAFARMIVFTIFAPVAFLFFPISAGVVSSWFREFLARSLLFPGAFLMLFLAAIIMGDPVAPWFTKESGMGISGIAPDLLTYSVNTFEKTVTLPDGSTSTIEVSYLTRMAALMIIMMIPTLQQFIMQMLKVTENIMVEGAKQQFKSVASKVPFIGGMFSM